MSQIYEDEQMMNFSQCPPIILASQSPRRKKILEEAGFSFRVVSADVEETTLTTASETVQVNAKLKCETIAQEYPDHLIIAADTVVSLDEKILEKPNDLHEAREMLRSLSGRSHEVMTAVSIIYENKKINFMDTSKVYFRDLSDEKITVYISKVTPLDKAGAYNIDEEGELIIEKFEGEYENIMGLPINFLIQEINKLF